MALSLLHEVAGQTLYWRPGPGAGVAYELLAEEQVVAWLDWERGVALAEAEDGAWTMTTEELLVPHLLVRPARFVAIHTHTHPHADTRDAALSSDVWRNSQRDWTWDTASGRRISWRLAEPDSPDWICVDGAGQMLTHTIVEQRGLLLWPAPGTRVYVTAQAQKVPELSLLVLIGWYLVLRAAQYEELGA